MKSPATKLALILSLYASAPLLAATPPTPATPTTPTIPPRIFAITDFGAVGDDKTMCNDAIKEAVSAATKAGGGVVLVPATEAGGATFLTGPIALASTVELRVEKGATLQFSSNPDDFPAKSTRHADLISIRNAHDVAITGEGTIEGAGETWWNLYTHPPAGAEKMPKRPFLINIAGCQRLLIENIFLANSPSTAILAGGCSDVTINHIRIAAADDSPTTIGIEFTGQNLSISDSTVDVGDDDIVFKSAGQASPDHPECANLRISNCTIQHGRGIVIGAPTTGGLRGLSVSHCTFDGTQYGLRLRAERTRGGLCEDIAYDDITMTNVKVPLSLASYFPTIPKSAASDKPQPLTPNTPIWRNIRISNLSATGSPSAGYIVGLPEQPITDVSLSNITIAASRPMEITHAKNIRFTNAQITVSKGKPVVTTDAEVTGIDTVSNAATAPGAPANP
ncbi:MAG TPA: glycosyl hydrolase family 28 protein [Phycisphaerae bacterium]|nr:glycosyl hydrolase family 28 protein [Phycisphaerae bacterium]